jgi:uncharacterized membrane protein YjjP (DUF1212 family)
MLLEHGAETRRVFETVRELATLLGVAELHVLVNHRSVVMTVGSADEAVTRIVRVGTLGVNLTTVSAISRVYRRLQGGPARLEEVSAELDRVAALPPHYPRWLVTLMVGLACAAFSRIFEGDWRAVAPARRRRRWACHRHDAATPLPPLLQVFCAAFGSAHWRGWARACCTAPHPTRQSRARCLPGARVPMINAVADLVKGHLLTGLARALTVA